MRDAALEHQGQGRRWPVRGAIGRKGVLAAVVTLLLHALALVGLIRGFELSPQLEFAPRAPLQVTLIRPESISAPVAPRPRAQAPAVRPSRPAPVPRPPARVTVAQPAVAPVVAPEPAVSDMSAEGVIDPAAVATTPEPAPAEEEPDTVASAEPPVADGPPGDPSVLARIETPVPDQAQAGARQALYGVALGAPAPGRSRFQVYFGDYTENNAVALMDYTVETDGDRYRVTTEGRAQGLTALLYSGVMTQSSSGRLGPDGLMPERFVEQRGKRPERWSAIDYAGAQASFSGGQRVPLQPGSQDRLSMVLQLGLILRAQPQRLAAGQTVTIPELGSRSIDPAVFGSEGDEVLVTPSGPLRTIHLVRRDIDPARDTKVDVWLGYDQQLKPVRIRLTDVGGRVLDQLLVP